MKSKIKRPWITWDWRFSISPDGFSKIFTGTFLTKSFYFSLWTWTVKMKLKKSFYKFFQIDEFLICLFFTLKWYFWSIFTHLKQVCVMFQIFVQKLDFSGELIIFQQRAYFYHFFGLFQKIHEKAKHWSSLLSPF